jgi:hypothetical protein
MRRVKGVSFEGMGLMEIKLCNFLFTITNYHYVVASDSVAIIGKQSRFANSLCLPMIASSLRFPRNDTLIYYLLPIPYLCHSL